MPSRALLTWNEASSQRLDELFAAHVSVGGSARGRRFATQELNAAIVVQVAAHFQGFCRDLHSEAADAVVGSAPVAFQAILRRWYSYKRGLDSGNAQASNIYEDFRRFDFEIKDVAEAQGARTRRRMTRLEQLNTWRNAIAHRSPLTQGHRAIVGSTKPTLAWARTWRSACHGLAHTFDAVVGIQVEKITGAPPW